MINPIQQLERKISQSAPISANARTRQSSDSAWPLRRANGLTWAESKRQQRILGDM